MNYRHILITGGAGFVGANLAVWLKTRHPAIRIVAMDNLMRRGSELNLPRLQAAGVEFVHADVRVPDDLSRAGREIDLLLDCAAEPSVLAGYGEQTANVVQTNLGGTANCLELARRSKADVLYISTSRVYPMQALNAIATDETPDRYVIRPDQTLPGVSPRGINEGFPLEGVRSLYGATKLCSELLIQEYADMFGLRFVINRCGVIAGPWQMGKVDQGVFAFWMGRHCFGSELSYIGWGGEGKQVRDVLHVDDLAELIGLEMEAMDRLAGRTFNVGGGAANALSLAETTELCRELSGREIPIRGVAETRAGDVKVYVTDNGRVSEATGWAPRHSPRDTLTAIASWLRDSEATVSHLWR